MSKHLKNGKGMWLMSSRAMLASALAFAMTTATGAPDAPVARSYLVSAVLRRGNEGMTIRLVHAVLVGRSEEEASGAFLKKVQNDYQSYAVLDTLTTPLAEPSPMCRRTDLMHASF